MQPGLLMASGGGGSGDHHRFRILSDAGIPVMFNYDWTETTPLGRAEWVKLMAALLNKEDEVNRKFDAVEIEYKRLRDLSAKVGEKPEVITGMHYKDAWFVPGGQSYMAGFFRDAGANYRWSDSKESGSLSLAFESVYPTALSADVWLNVDGGYIVTREGIIAKDIRYRDFKAMKSGKVFGYFNRVSENGSNDYWESGPVNPHLVLADMIRIFHPGLLPRHELVYYKQIR